MRTVYADNMEVDAQVALEVAFHEALVRQTYRDSKGILTWCVGMTNATGHHVERYLDKPASLQHCMNLFVWALDNYAAGVRRAFKGYRLTKAQFAGAMSFHWNTGQIETASWVKHFKAGDMKKARAAFLEWQKPKEVKARREKEAELLFDGKWASNGTMTEYTRLKPNHTPDWASGKKISVKTELHNAFLGRKTPKLDGPMLPDVIPLVPTLSPAGIQLETGFWGWLLKILFMFKRK